MRFTRRLKFQSTLPRGERLKTWVRFVNRKVSIHAPARGATDRNAVVSEIGLFQSTLPRGERPSQSRNTSFHDGFNPRSRAGSDAPAYSCPPHNPSFNPRSRAGSDRQSRASDALAWFQSTLPRGERREMKAAIRSACVSIHAPARGATVSAGAINLSGLFQSTLPRGERQAWEENGERMICFNPRSRAGSDANAKLKELIENVSIHAPARGATKKTPPDPIDYEFQSTLPRGERRATTTPLLLTITFQSTLPRGERLRVCDEDIILVDVSIHAPARGATVAGFEGDGFAAFQSTLPRGERHDDHSTGLQRARFNPRSRAGSDGLLSNVYCHPVCFNPRSRAGSDG